MPPTSPTPLVTAKEQHLVALLTSICARVDAVEQQLGSTSQLAGQLNTFAAQIAANEARLEERLLEMANAASVEQRFLQAKLETVETTFQRCNAALQGLQAAVFAAPSGAPPGSEPPGLGGFRDRLDELAREANRSGVKERELDDKLVALTVAMQANHAEAEQRITWTSTTLHQAIMELVPMPCYVPGRRGSIGTAMPGPLWVRAAACSSTRRESLRWSPSCRRPDWVTALRRSNGKC